MLKRWEACDVFATSASSEVSPYSYFGPFLAPTRQPTKVRFRGKADLRQPDANVRSGSIADLSSSFRTSSRGSEAQKLRAT
jgi:hypothetical protein